jgi:molybdate transport system substrate-binding protein
LPSGLRPAGHDRDSLDHDRDSLDHAHDRDRGRVDHDRSRRPVGRLLVLAAGLLALLGLGLSAGGCGSGGDESTLTVAAASSLRPAFGHTGDGGLRFTFGGSDLLANQIRQGAKVDVIAAASTIQPDSLFDEGLVEEPVEFAGNRLVIGVPEGSGIESVSDIAEPGTSLLVGDGSVPIGIYAREMLTRLPPSTSAAIMDNVRSEEQDASSITAKLTQGAADAGIIYETDVLSAPGKLRAVPIPERLQPRIAYSAAVVASSDLKGQAREFIQSLLAGAGAAELEKAGLLPPP